MELAGRAARPAPARRRRARRGRRVAAMPARRAPRRGGRSWRSRRGRLQAAAVPVEGVTRFQPSCGTRTPSGEAGHAAPAGRRGRGTPGLSSLSSPSSCSPRQTARVGRPAATRSRSASTRPAPVEPLACAAAKAPTPGSTSGLGASPDRPAPRGSGRAAGPGARRRPPPRRGSPCRCRTMITADRGIKHPLGARHVVIAVTVGHRLAQRQGQGLEGGLGAVVVVARRAARPRAAWPRRRGERAQHVPHVLAGQRADRLAPQAESHPAQGRPERSTTARARRLVQRRVGRAEARDPAPLPQRLVQGLAQGQRAVLGGVVVVHLQVAAAASAPGRSPRGAPARRAGDRGSRSRCSTRCDPAPSRRSVRSISVSVRRALHVCSAFVHGSSSSTARAGLEHRAAPARVRARARLGAASPGATTPSGQHRRAARAARTSSGVSPTIQARVARRGAPARGAPAPGRACAGASSMHDDGLEQIRRGRAREEALGVGPRPPGDDAQAAARAAARSSNSRGSSSRSRSRSPGAVSVPW